MDEDEVTEIANYVIWMVVSNIIAILALILMLCPLNFCITYLEPSYLTKYWSVK